MSLQLRGVREPFTMVTFQLYLNSGFSGVSKLYGPKDHINYQIMLKISLWTPHFWLNAFPTRWQVRFIILKN